MPRTAPRIASTVGLLALAAVMAWAAGCGDPPPAPPNQYPYTSTPIPAITAYIGDTVTVRLSEHFTDPEGDALTYSATSSDTEVVTVTVTDSEMDVVPEDKGEATVTVTATDDEGLKAKHEVSATVGNRPPTLVDSIPPLERYIGQVAAFYLPDHFEDLDGDSVTFGATSSDETILTAQVNEEDTLILEATAKGEARITVWAIDSDSARSYQEVPALITPIPERRVLELIYEAAGGEDWTRSDNWGTDADLDTWYGIEVDNEGSVVAITLSDNNLVGKIAPQLGALEHLERLDLEANALSGELPVSISGQPLTELRISGNADLTAELGDDFRDLRDLEAFMAGGTEVCAPNSSVFADWLERIPERRVKVCDPVESGAYLVQAVQSLEDTAVVPLVADKMATLRLFVTSEYSTHEKIPPAKAYFYADGEELGSFDIPAKDESIPTYIDEGSSELSGNVDISADFIQPDLEMYIQVDPEGTLDEELGVAKRIPKEDYIEYSVYQLAAFDLTIIPFLWEDDPDSAILDYVADMAENEEDDGRLQATFDLLPMDRLDVSAYEATESSSNCAHTLLSETNTIRLADGGDGYYQGQMSGTVTCAAGVAWLNHKASFSIPDGITISHELGHNLNLRHAPCNDPNDTDPSFPQEDGSIGNYGWSFRTNSVYDKDDYYDMMGYCDLNWISGYFFEKAARYRRARSSMYMPPSSSPAQSLLLWGGLDEDGRPYLRPSFVIELASELPHSGGDHQLVGQAEDGKILFSLRFDMPEIADLPGKASVFTYALPVEGVWAGELARITLVGPGGVATLDQDSDAAMTIARAGKHGPIRAFWDGWREPVPGRPELVLLRSRGIPGPEEWAR